MSWAAQEMKGAELGDERLNQRAIKILDRLGEKPSLSIPAACKGWDETKAAYRFFHNDKVSPERVLAPHTKATLQRARSEAVVLALVDTTELSFTGKNNIRGLGPLSYRAERGMYLHAMLAVTPERVSLGALDALMWARDPDGYGRSGEQAGAPIEEKESIRWLESYRILREHARSLPSTQLVYVADRESDIYEIFVEAAQQDGGGGGADLLIRSQHDRRLADGGKLRDKVATAPALGTIEFDLPPRNDEPGRHVVQTLRATRVRLTAPDDKPHLPDVEVTVVLAREDHPPNGNKPVVWFLLTTIPIDTLEDAAELIQWYLCRWQIEVFFRILKSGCEIEKLQLELIDRLENAIAFFLIVAWRILFLTRLGRQCPDLPCDAVFTADEWHAAHIVAKRSKPPAKPPTLNKMIRLVATFGGFLNRKGDGEPGPKTLWTGLQRLRDFVIALDAQRCG
jgi:Transposase Tn5 dimerisation domain/Transposase DNA-binding